MLIFFYSSCTFQLSRLSTAVNEELENDKLPHFRNVRLFHCSALQTNWMLIVWISSSGQLSSLNIFVKRVSQQPLLRKCTLSRLRLLLWLAIYTQIYFPLHVLYLSLNYEYIGRRRITYQRYRSCLSITSIIPASVILQHLHLHPSTPLPTIGYRFIQFECHWLFFLCFRLFRMKHWTETIQKKCN